MTFDDLIAPLAVTPPADPSANWKRPTAKGKRRTEGQRLPRVQGIQGRQV